MQIDRLFQIVYALLEKEERTARELAEQLEVSVRTVYRDVEILSRAGIPIYTVRGKNGGLRLMDSFLLKSSILTGKEQGQVLSALQGMEALQAEQVQPILTKLSAIFGRKEDSWLQVDFSDWGMKRQQQYEEIRRAIVEKRILEFEYYSSAGEKTHRKVEPLQLWFKSKDWYLKAYCLRRKAPRIFRLTRMKQVTVRDENFSSRTVSEGWEINLQDGPAPSILRFTLRVAASQAYRVYDDFEEEDICRQEDGTFLVQAEYPEDAWVYGFLLSYGPYAEVLEPDSLRKVLREHLQKMLELYSEYDVQMSE